MQPCWGGARRLASRQVRMRGGCSNRPRPEPRGGTALSGTRLQQLACSLLRRLQAAVCPAAARDVSVPEKPSTTFKV